MRQHYLGILGFLTLLCGGCTNVPSGPTFTNSLGIKFVRIEPGSFQMGEGVQPLPDELIRPLSYPTLEEMERRFPLGEFSRFVLNLDHVRLGDFDEKPRHRVTITRPFYMGVLEITNAQYELFDPDHRLLRGKAGFSKGKDEAVVFVDWHEATAFCEWLTSRDGFPYRLPTEAEWEYSCRAGTSTVFWTGNQLPQQFHKNARRTSFDQPDQDVVDLTVGRTPANPWGLQDMHGNVEEWTADWYGPYRPVAEEDPVGYAYGDFKVTRGGSHGTNLYFLRSANRMGTLPENKHWLIGFRVALGDPPETPALPLPPFQLYQRNVRQEVPDSSPRMDPEKPYFKGPRPYVKIAPGSQGPLYSHHNHDPAIVECPNGDLLAIWYTCVEERGREVGIGASRLRFGEEEWDEASAFWDTPDRNDHCPALWFDGNDTIYHFNGLSVAGRWEPLAIIMRTSKDNGVTWSKARLIVPEHGFRQMVGEPVFRHPNGSIAFGADAGNGSTIWISEDEGTTWKDPGGTIHGIHAGIVPLRDKRLFALGRGMNIDGMMPQSISADMGRTWTATRSVFPPLRGGQRPVLIRLREGPLFFASFAENIRDPEPTDQDRRHMTSLFGAVSFDEGQTWPVRRMITNGEPDHRVHTIDGGPIRMSPTSAEPQGYLSACQSADRVIHLISSVNHYAFNLAWLQETPTDPGLWPRAKTLDTKANLASVFSAATLPSKSEIPWNYLGAVEDEPRAARLVEPNQLHIESSAAFPGRWSNEKLAGISGEDLSRGMTAEIQTRVLRSRRNTGVDLELFIRGGALTVNRYRLTVTASAVYYWHDRKPKQIAEGLDNSTALHRYRLSVREDTAVQIYRDGRLLSVQPMDITIDWRAPARGSHLEWGLSDSAAEALVGEVSFDSSGAFR